MPDYRRYRALSFDCYGTLVDWEAGILAWARPWLARTNAALDERGFIEAFGRFERAQQEATPDMLYPAVLARVLERVGEGAGIPVAAADARAFGASVGDWPPFADSGDALATLKQSHKLIILSNVDRASFRRTNHRLGVAFDRVITAEGVGAYKPDPRNFAALLATVTELGLEKAQLLHVGESMHHDVLPANRLGIDVVWIDRAGDGDRPRASGAIPVEARPLAQYPSLAAFVVAFTAP